MAMQKAEQLNKAVEWLTKSRELIDGTSLSLTNRSRVACGLLHLSLEHHMGIVFLAEREVFGAALELLRPQFEAYIRGVWYLLCAQDKDVQRFINGTKPPEIGVLIADIEALEGYNTDELSQMKSVAWDRLCDYTHGGMTQMKARNTVDGITNNYNPEHIFNVIQVSAKLTLFAGIEIANMAEKPELANGLMALYKDIFS